jgi:hypothetical protein
VWGAQPQYGQYAQYGQYPQGQWPAQPPWGAPTKTNTCALLALIFSFFCFPAGLVLGIVALSQLKRSQDTGRGLAIAGIVISSLWIPLIALFIGLGVSGAFDDYGVQTGTVSDATTTTVGDCMLSSDNGFPNAVVLCSDPHDQEVYFVGALGSGEYPGDAAVFDRADEICHREFSGYVGRGYATSDYDYDYYAPDSDEWDISEERRVVCVITPTDSTTTGSAYHSGR